MALKVLIIAGGLTHERDVSVRSGRRVANILTQAGYTVRVADVDHQLTSVIDEFAPDVIWPVVHGSIGEDGSLQTLLEAIGIPFVGSSSVQAMLASNKPTAKSLLGFTPPDPLPPNRCLPGSQCYRVTDSVPRHHQANRRWFCSWPLRSS